MLPQVIAGHLTFSLCCLKQRIPVLQSSVRSVRASGIVFGVSLFSGCLLFGSSSLAQGSADERLFGRWSNADPESTLNNRHILGAAASLPNGRAIVVGGLDVGAPGFPATAAAEIYDPVARTWTPVKPMSIGVDTLVFAGCIGENSPAIRWRICDGLEFLGIELDESRNADSETVISTNASQTTVRVIRTNEEITIARSVMSIIGLQR